MIKQARSTKKELDRILSNILQCGLVLSLTILAIGAVLFVLQSGEQEVNTQVFFEKPNILNSIRTVYLGVINGNNEAIMQLGVIVLMLTPVVRVGTCLWIFYLERDLLYVIISTMILLILGFSFS